MLNKGDYVIYGIHGLCHVEDTLVPPFLERGKEKLYYAMVSAVDKKGVLYVPVDGAEDKMREAINADDCMEMIDSIEDVDCLKIATGKKAEGAILDIVKRNVAPEMLRLIKTLRRIKCIRLSEGRKFATTDEKYLAMAEKLLYSEMSFALGREYEDVRESIVSTLKSLPFERV